MTVGETGTATKYLRILLQEGTVTGLSDRELLSRFVDQNGSLAEVAFAALVERHGPMVLRVCGSVLDDCHAAEDAFQATFLVLALRARSVRNRDSLASWLFGVAQRAARKARTATVRRRMREQRGAEMAAQRASAEPQEPWAELHEEVDRLPEKYRAPIVLCYLEGLTHEEAAEQLRWPLGTVKVRLSRGRDRLRDRLNRRGLAPVVIADAVSRPATSAISSALLESIVHAATVTVTRRVIQAPARITSIAEGVLHAMFLAKLRTIAALIGASLIMLAFGSVSLLAGLAYPAHSKESATPVHAPGNSRPKIEREVALDHKLLVDVEVVKRSNFIKTTSQLGTVYPIASAELYSKISGYLKSLKVDIGDKVTKGQVIAELEVPELDADLEKDKAAVILAKAGLARAQSATEPIFNDVEIKRAESKEASALVDGAKATLAHRQSQYKRLQSLAQQNSVDSKVVEEAKAQCDTARADLDAATARQALTELAIVRAQAEKSTHQAEVAEAQAKVLVAEAAVAKSMVLLANARIKAPFDGNVSERGLSPGSFVRAGDSVGAAPIVTVIRTDKVRAVVNVPDADISLLKRGQKVIVELQGRAPERAGAVSRFAGVENPDTRTAQVEVDLDNQGGQLRPGQSVVVKINLLERPNIISIPFGALAEQSPGRGVCFRVVNNRAVRTELKLGESNQARVEILEGLDVGDTVITKPDSHLKDGQLLDETTETDAERN